MLGRVSKVFSFFIASIIFYFIVISLLSIGNLESDLMLQLYIATVAGGFNLAFVLVMLLTKFVDVFNLSRMKQFQEMSLYIVLMLSFDYLYRNVSFSPTMNNFFQYPYSYIYPCILIFIIILSIRKSYIGTDL